MVNIKIDGQLIEGGYISLQSESHPIDFRKVELLNLAGCMDKGASNYKSYYVKSVPAELDRVAMRHRAVPEHEHELVLRAVQRAHAGV